MEIDSKIDAMLNQILILDSDFKIQIRQKISILPDKKINQLKVILREVIYLQERIIAQELERHPELKDELAAVRQETNREILAAKSARYSSEDEAKMKKILDTIDSL